MFFTSIIISVGGIVLTKPILRLIDLNETIMPDAVTFMIIFFRFDISIHVQWNQRHFMQSRGFQNTVFFLSDQPF
jgi:hypothetical protein